MSDHGGRRPGSGRKKIHSSRKEAKKHWRNGHHRIHLDNILYSSWLSTRIKCGYRSNSQFAAHLLSLEWQRRENNRMISSEKQAADHEKGDGPSLKHPCHSEESTTVKLENTAEVESSNLSLDSTEGASDSDIDVTGVSDCE